MIHRTHPRTIGFCVLFGSAFSLGCGAAVGDGEDYASITEPSFVINGVPLFTENNWEVPVCFMPESTAPSDAYPLFETYVREQWGAKTGLSFSGFETCTSTESPWVNVFLKAGENEGDWGGLGSYGVGSRHDAGGGLWVQLSQAVAPGKSFFPSTVVHEMGHVLGLIHEQNRPDMDPTARRCDPNSGVAEGHFLASVPDSTSIMNYCSTDNGVWDVNDPTLTPLDVAGGQLVYGRPPTATAEAAFAEVAFDASIFSPLSFNSSGAANSATWAATGVYVVNFPRNGQAGGNVQVTALSGNTRCKVNGWDSGSGTGAAATVNCRTPSGAMTDAPFTASFVGRWDTPGIEGGYVWASDPTSTQYTPTGSYVWNSTGQSVTIQRTATGVYSVTFNGQNFDGGTAEVTAYGGGSEYCKLESLTRVGSNKQAIVRCFSTSGQAVNAVYSLRISRVSPENTPSYTYAYADQSTTPSYQISSANRLAFRANASGGSTGLYPVSVERGGTGVYTVTLPQMMYTDDSLVLYKKSNVHVSAVGTNANYCNYNGRAGDNIGVPDASARVFVTCFNAQGSPSDTRFMVNYASALTDPPGPRIVATVEREPQTCAPGGQFLSRVSSNVYFVRCHNTATGPQIARVGTAGGSTTNLVTETGGAITGLAADSSSLFWTNANSQLKKSTLSGGTITTVGSNLGFTILRPSLDATNVYFLARQQFQGNVSAIKKISRNGGTATTLATDEVTSELISDGTWIYWSARTPNNAGRVARVRITGGSVQVLANFGGGSLVLNSGTLYYSVMQTNAIFKVPAGGGNSTLLADNLPRDLGDLTSLVTDGSSLYALIQTADPVIAKISVNGGVQAYLGWRQHTPGPLVLDSTNVYYMAHNPGPALGYFSLLKVAK